MVKKRKGAHSIALNTHANASIGIMIKDFLVNSFIEIFCYNSLFAVSQTLSARFLVELLAIRDSQPWLDSRVHCVSETRHHLLCLYLLVLLLAVFILHCYARLNNKQINK
jgi:hypothetical protein